MSSTPDLDAVDQQIAKMTALIADNKLKEALLDIGQSFLPGTDRQNALRMSLMAAVYFGLGDFAKASSLNKKMMFSEDVRDWAAFQEGLESLRCGRSDHALLCFKLSFDYGLAPGIQYVERGEPRPFMLLLSEIEARYPGLFPDKIGLVTVLETAVFEWSTLGKHFTQHDYVLGLASGGLTQAASDVIETLLHSHWQAYEAGDLPLPEYVANLTAAEKADLSARHVLIVMPSHDDRAGRPVELETVYHQRATLTEVGVKVDVCTDPVFGNSDPQVAARLLRRNLDRFKPDTIIFMVDVGGNCNPTFAGELERLKAEYGFNVLGMLNDPNEGHGSICFLDKWIEVVDMFFTLPCDNPGVRDLKATGHLIDAMPIFETKFIETCTLDAKSLDLVHCGNWSAIRVAMLDAMETVFDNNFISMRRRENSEPLSIKGYLEKLRAGRFAINSNRELSFEVTRGRVFENVAAGVLLFDFDSPQGQRCYTPFIHYVPISNRDQLVQFARFFRKNPHWRDKIAEEGRALWLGPLSPKQTWGAIFGAMDRRCRERI